VFCFFYLIERSGPSFAHKQKALIPVP